VKSLRQRIVSVFLFVRLPLLLAMQIRLSSQTLLALTCSIAHKASSAPACQCVHPRDQPSFYARLQVEDAALAALHDAWAYGFQQQQQQQQQPPTDFHDVYKYGLLRVLLTMQRWRQSFMSLQSPAARGSSTGITGSAGPHVSCPVLDGSMLVFSEFVRLFLQGKLQD
jgi:hypothetical protein